MQGVFLAGRLLFVHLCTRLCVVCVCTHGGVSAHSAAEETAENIESKGQRADTEEY